jgi:septum formation protein
MELYLASRSPRRQKILAGLGVEFWVEASEAEEIRDETDPVRTVAANALAKAAACRARHRDAAIIAADTLVWFQGRLIGKPRDLGEAAEFLKAFSGKTQIVFTGLALCRPGQEPETRVEASSVRFKALSGEAIHEYLERTKPLDRAGAYDIDENGDLLIAGYSGSYTNIMGMPQAPVRDWISSLR